MSSALSPAGEVHPGEITFIDHVDNRIWVERATEVPATMAWVEVDARWRAVVRIEINGTADRRELTMFGQSHEFLETTTMTLGPASPASVEPLPTPSGK